MLKRPEDVLKEDSNVDVKKEDPSDVNEAVMD